MTSPEALAVLQDALTRCATEDMRTSEVDAALTTLAANASEQWPFDQFWQALEIQREFGAADTARWQVLNASLNGIRRVCGK